MEDSFGHFLLHSYYTRRLVQHEVLHPHTHIFIRAVCAAVVAVVVEPTGALAHQTLKHLFQSIQNLIMEGKDVQERQLSIQTAAAFFSLYVAIIFLISAIAFPGFSP